jgi:hypothetical protein
MAFYVQMDEELVGALDENGCFHDPDAVNGMLTEYGVTDPESRRVARRLLRFLGIGRAEALFDDEEEA